MNTNSELDFHLMIMMVVGPMLIRWVMEKAEYAEAQRYYDREFQLITENYE